VEGGQTLSWPSYPKLRRHADLPSRARATRARDGEEGLGEGRGGQANTVRTQRQPGRKLIVTCKRTPSPPMRCTTEARGASLCSSKRIHCGMQTNTLAPNEVYRGSSRRVFVLVEQRKMGMKRATIIRGRRRRRKEEEVVFVSLFALLVQCPALSLRKPAVANAPTPASQGGGETAGPCVHQAPPAAAILPSSSSSTCGCFSGLKAWPSCAGSAGSLGLPRPKGKSATWPVSKSELGER